MPTYNTPLAVQERIDNDYSYHAPRPGQIERYQQIRASAKAFAELVVQETPYSREQSLALTHIEQAVMFANAAIARHEKEVTK